MNNIDELNVSDNWKKIFYAIQKYDFQGNFFGKPSEEYQMYSKEDQKKIKQEIYSFGTIFWCIMLGPIYYFFKGMWLKGIIFTFIVILLAGLFILLNIPDRAFQPVAIGLDVFFGIWAPFCYYRLKVFNSQW
jgi:hypothetical protein